MRSAASWSASGESVPIKPQVFDVLLYLLEHRDRVVGKNELFDNVWDGRIVSDQLWRRPRNIARRNRSLAVEPAMQDSGA
jgi:DNA-binding winged helix-turn-helix (wHTH) protein